MTKELIFFYLQSCPYCLAADQYLAELWQEDPSYQKIPIRKIEETEQPEIADRYDYYYVPCFWLDGVKLHEGACTKEDVRRVLDAARSSAK